MLALAACSAPKPVAKPPLEIPTWAWIPIPRLGPVEALRGPRPAIDLTHLIPDPRAELRWPLGAGTHPALEPSYAVDYAFSRPRTTWRELCALGVTESKDPYVHPAFVSYLRGWCHVEKRNIDLAVSELGQVLGMNAGSLSEAARKDLANVLADAGDGANALKLLARSMIDDEQLDDLLSATYAEVGSLDDARLFSDRAMERTRSTDTAIVQCHRLARRAVLAGSEAAGPDLEWIQRLAITSGDKTCRRLDHELQCWKYSGLACKPYFAEVGIAPRELFRFAAYTEWPEGEAPAAEWWKIATRALDGMPLRGADWMATIALDRAVRTTTCGSPSLAAYRFAAEQVLEDPAHDEELDEVLLAVVGEQTTLCSPRRRK